MKILVTGASGLIGRELIYRLMTSGHEVRALARHPEKLPEIPSNLLFQWSDDEIPPPSAVAGCDAVIHLAGEGIVDKLWTPSRKQRLWDSRVTGTRNVVTAITSLTPASRPKVFLSGSAIGIYGDDDLAKSEDDTTGSGFLADLCKAWEAEANKAKELGVRTINLRTGLVLSHKGGLLSKSGPIVLGRGKQWMSWIHIEDLIGFILFALEKSDATGPFNLTAPNPVTNLEFTKIVAKAQGFPFTLQVPAFALKAVLGDMAKAVLANQRILPQKMISLGFKFKYENLNQAIGDLIRPGSKLDNYFHAKQFVPRQRHEIFSFFGAAENLEKLTPPWLHFHITQKSTAAIEQGSLIEYKLKIHKVPVRWKTLISQWNPEFCFVDEQLKGPYKKWHHVHKFESVPGGTLISDDVTFQIPGGFLGKLALPLIKKDVQQIFSYRQEKIKTLYPIQGSARGN